MGLLEQVIQMKNQGIEDRDIIGNLQEQGISPRQISDALSQVKIKNAISGESDPMSPPFSMQTMSSSAYPKTQEVNEEYIPSETQNIQTMPYPTQSTQEEYYPQENSQGQYDSQQEYNSYSGSSVDTIIEVAEQVVSEKIKTIQKQVESFNEFKSISAIKIENISERLKKVESIIDRLQVAIIEKVGSYGDNLEQIKKEMSMMQDSFGKVVNQAVHKKK